MSYTLQAIIADKNVVDSLEDLGIGFVCLPQGKALIPLADEVLQSRGIPPLPLTDDNASELPIAIEEIVAKIAAHGRAAYIEAEFFGGIGTQACATCEERGRVSAPQIGDSAINVALRFLGVEIENRDDEFDALGLGRFRATNDWVSEVVGRSGRSE